MSDNRRREERDAARSKQTLRKISMNETLDNCRALTEKILRDDKAGRAIDPFMSIQLANEFTKLDAAMWYSRHTPVKMKTTAVPIVEVTEHGFKERVLRAPTVEQMLGISAATLLRYERTVEGFPRRRRIGPNVVGWLESEIVEFLRSRPQQGGNRPDKAIAARRK